MIQPSFTLNQKEPGVIRDEIIRIAHGRVHAELSAFRFVDRDTKQIILFIPSIDISSYGENFIDAREMLKNSLEGYFQFLLKMKPGEFNSELRRNGWRQRLYHNKNYAKHPVENLEDLGDYNVEEGSLEKLALVA